MKNEIWDAGFEACLTFTEDGLTRSVESSVDFSTLVDDTLLQKIGVSEFMKELKDFNEGNQSLLGTKCPDQALRLKFGETLALKRWQQESVFNSVTDPKTGRIKYGWSVGVILKKPTVYETGEDYTISFDAIKHLYPMARMFTIKSFYKMGWIPCEVPHKMTLTYLLGLQVQGIEKVQIKLDTGEEPDYLISNLIEMA